MRLMIQDTNIKVKNFDFKRHNSGKPKHSQLLPNSITAVIVGPSNCGNTNVLMV